MWEYCSHKQVILESARLHLSRETGGTVGRRHMAPFLVPVSATSANSLARQIQHVKDYCKSPTVAAQDLAHTLGARRDHHRHRAFAIMAGDTDISELPAFESGTTSTKPPEQLVFVFTGQGAQWPGMGKELIPAFDTFRADIRRLDGVLQSLPVPPTWSMEGTCKASSSPQQNKDLQRPGYPVIMTPFSYMAHLFTPRRAHTLSLCPFVVVRPDFKFSCHLMSY
ncbi:hypothetical protein BDW42DRAFT_13018 [Aspergillus taichungensis]|uniref:Malonyl-CoA:ACP transacylase (MAT) domain-containing protein n=1 Tax=Aspergillus taichungensis TaxID=482145 RepID=A0A2J5HIK8_9EURO|nr:hypothetical protein BDW42DRAFT_13018 [Aspergillus taichungensis]